LRAKEPEFLSWMPLATASLQKAWMLSARVVKDMYFFDPRPLQCKSFLGPEGGAAVGVGDGAAVDVGISGALLAHSFNCLI